MKNKNLLLLLADRKYGLKPFKVLKDLEKSQYYPTEKLEEMQLEYYKIFLDFYLFLFAYHKF